MNIITKTQLGSGNKMEKIMIDRCALKYISEKDDTTTKSYIARLITQKYYCLVSYFYILSFISFTTY